MLRRLSPGGYTPFARYNMRVHSFCVTSAAVFCLCLFPLYIYNRYKPYNHPLLLYVCECTDPPDVYNIHMCVRERECIAGGSIVSIMFLFNFELSGHDVLSILLVELFCAVHHVIPVKSDRYWH